MMANWTPLALAQAFHEAYERLAPQFGYETRRKSAVPWEAVPEQIRELMMAVCAEMLGLLQLRTLKAENERLRAVIERSRKEHERLRGVLQTLDRPLTRAYGVLLDALSTTDKQEEGS